MPNYNLTEKAKDLLRPAATEGDEQGFIDDYHYQSGGTPIERPHDHRSTAEFNEATEQLVQHRLATRLHPQHMRDRRGFQLKALVPFPDRFVII